MLRHRGLPTLLLIALAAAVSPSVHAHDLDGGWIGRVGGLDVYSADQAALLIRDGHTAASGDIVRADLCQGLGGFDWRAAPGRIEITCGDETWTLTASEPGRARFERRVAGRVVERAGVRKAD